jgi:acetyltransferase-like isoleucine patch superfamily enzyme
VKAHDLEDRGRARLPFPLASLLPERWTVFRLPHGQPAPDPAVFARYGDRSWIVPPAAVTGAEWISVGDDVVVMEGIRLDVAAAARLTIGDRVRLARFVTVSCTVGVEIGDDVSTSDCVGITDNWGPGDAPLPPAPVVIEAGAYLGANCQIGPGVRVGSGAFVGEGSTVIDDVPAHTVVYGNPATVTRRLRDGRWEGPVLPGPARRAR